MTLVLVFKVIFSLVMLLLKNSLKDSWGIAEVARAFMKLWRSLAKFGKFWGTHHAIWTRTSLTFARVPAKVPRIHQSSGEGAFVWPWPSPQQKWKEHTPDQKRDLTLAPFCLIDCYYKVRQTRDVGKSGSKRGHWPFIYIYIYIFIIYIHDYLCIYIYVCLCVCKCVCVCVVLFCFVLFCVCVLIVCWVFRSGWLCVS